MSWIKCRDGFKVSVIEHNGSYSLPRDEGLFPKTHVEVGYPSQRPEPWSKWKKYAETPEHPTRTIYAYVPVELVDELIRYHDDPRRLTENG